jgi:protein gp37
MGMMADGTAIEWTDATWNPITGCSVVSPGCTNCYAMKLAGARLKHIPSRTGLTIDTKAGPVWNGQVRFNEQWLDQPLRWKAPRMIFVCAHGDLFHESVPDEWIDKVFAVMALAPQHTFQVLTKRAERMRAYLAASRASPVALEALQITLIEHCRDAKSKVGKGCVITGDIPHLKLWPLPNVWLGVSAEDQKRADERIPYLLTTPAAIRFVSAEPLLGEMNLAWALSSNRLEIAAGLLTRGHFAPGLETLRPLDQIIVGGESGRGARPMHPDWPRRIRDKCEAAGVPFFFKQWGAWAVASRENSHLDACMASNNAFWVDRSTGRLHKPSSLGLKHPIGMFRAGKKTTGRLLDGIEHNGMPEVREWPSM